MRQALLVAVTAGLIAPATAQAASLHVEQHGSSTFSIYLDGESLNDGFNGLSFRVRPGEDIRVELVHGPEYVANLSWAPSLDHPLTAFWSSSRPFGNVDSGSVAGIARPPGAPFTYRNRLLNADPLDQPETLGWTLLDVVVQPTEIKFLGGPLGERITTADQPNGRLFLANLNFGIPEPATAALASFALLISTTAGRVSSRRSKRPNS